MSAPNKQQPCWGDVVHFSSAKAAAEAFVSTVCAQDDDFHRAICVRIKGTFVVAKIVHVETGNEFAKAIEAIERCSSPVVCIPPCTRRSDAQTACGLMLGGERCARPADAASRATACVWCGRRLVEGTS
eukprot:6280156-Prymnesium_polylepis.1